MDQRGKYQDRLICRVGKGLRRVDQLDSTRGGIHASFAPIASRSMQLCLVVRDGFGDYFGSFHWESNDVAQAVFSVKPSLNGSKLCTAMSPRRGNSSAFVPMNSAS